MAAPRKRKGPVRITRVYTRTGDELNACLGLVRTALAGSKARARLLPIVARVQNELFNLGAHLATPDEARWAKQPPVVERHVTALEREMDACNADLPELRSFVLPGGGAASASFHLARTVCRRAERLAVALARSEAVGPEPVRYLNRVSDALFVFGRWASWKDGHAEALWEPEKT
jgi:cob(I)alamin adenosyltransferase